MRYLLALILLCSACSGAPIVQEPSDVFAFSDVSAAFSVDKDGAGTVIVTTSASLFKIPVALQTQGWRDANGEYSGRVCIMMSLLGPKPICFGESRP